MTYYEVTTCRLAIQVCVGYSPNGRARHRTFSMKELRADASNEAMKALGVHANFFAVGLRVL